MEPLILFLISLLVFIVVAAVVLWLARLIVANLPIPPAAQNAILALVALLLLIIFLVFVQRQGWLRL